MAYTNDGSYLLESEKKFPLETKIKKRFTSTANLHHVKSNKIFVISGVYSDINKQEKNKGHMNDYI